MPKQVVTTEIPGIKTDTTDRLDATITFHVEGMRNIPSLENLGRAADKATWLFQTLLEASYVKDDTERETQLAAARGTVRELVKHKEAATT